MQKPVCPKCSRYYRPKRNGTAYLEMKPAGDGLAPPGNAAPDQWEPYKLWHGDLWECLGCGNEIIVGAGNAPIAEHYQLDFERYLQDYNPAIKVNDC